MNSKIEEIKDVRNRNLSCFECTSYFLNGMLSFMGLILAITMMSLLTVENEAGRMKKAVSVTGLTAGFMLIFTVITFLLGFFGLFLTRRRDIPQLANSGYGFCVLFFVMLPLFIVGVGSQALLNVSDDRLKGICQVGLKTQRSKELRL